MEGLSRFLAWWQSELTGMVPTGVWRAVSGDRPVLAIAPGASGLEVTIHRRGKPPAALGRFDALSPPRRQRLRRDVRRSHLKAVLVLPERRVIRRRLRLPAAAEANLAEVIEFELERLTPFRPDELYRAWHIAERRPEAGQIELDLVLAPQSEIQSAETAASAAGLTPVARIDVSATDGTPAGIILAPSGVGPRPQSAAHLTAGLVAAIAALAGAWVWLESDRRHREAEALADALFQSRRMAASLGSATPLDTDDAALAAYRLKQASPMVVELLARVTQTLPDGTWLESLSYADGRLSLAGTSDRASALPGLFSENPRFEAPRFNAPITRQADGERFLLQVRLAGPSEIVEASR
ncbi:MAG: PilN domain-containing protein [Pikeienuella sp.]